LLFLVFILIFVQIFTTTTNRILTFHSKIERTILLALGKTYQILDGTRDENIRSSPIAIYKVTLRKDYIRYIVLAREKTSLRDFILLVNPSTLLIEQTLPLSPYFFLLSGSDYRGLLDLNNERHLELTCVVNSNTGKRIKILKVSTNGLVDLSFPFLENYTAIQIDDFNIDGTLDMVCSPIENGIKQPPSIFKLQGYDIKKQNLTLFPRLIRDFEAYLKSLERRTRKSGNPVIKDDLKVAKARLFVSLGKEAEFNHLEEQMRTELASPTITQKIRLYRMQIIKSYFSFEKGEQKEAISTISSAIEFLHGKNVPFRQKDSILNAEIANYYLWNDQWDKAEQYLKEALLLDPSNAITQQLNRDMHP
jgi:tetratricopeptide (TPR) repeat protein